MDLICWWRKEGLYKWKANRALICLFLWKLSFHLLHKMLSLQSSALLTHHHCMPSWRYPLPGCIYRPVACSLTAENIIIIGKLVFTKRNLCNFYFFFLLQLESHFSDLCTARGLWSTLTPQPPLPTIQRRPRSTCKKSRKQHSMCALGTNESN